MITAIFIKIFVTFVEKIALILPTVDQLPGNIQNSIDWFVESIVKWNTILPVDTMINIITIILGIESIILSFNILNFIINKIRGAGS